MEKNYLGIDWGKEKMGLAVAHDETSIALPFGVLTNDSLIFEKLGAIIQKEEVGTVVIGLSRRRFDTDISNSTEKFGQTLERTFPVKVAYTDEMFTSKLAQELLKAAGEKDVSQKDDAHAAKILLEEWLTRKKG